MSTVFDKILESGDNGNYCDNQIEDGYPMEIIGWIRWQKINISLREI
jgi:hypothetical protein